MDEIAINTYEFTCGVPLTEIIYEDKSKIFLIFDPAEATLELNLDFIAFISTRKIGVLNIISKDKINKSQTDYYSRDYIKIFASAKCPASIVGKMIVTSLNLFRLDYSKSSKMIVKLVEAIDKGYISAEEENVFILGEVTNNSTLASLIKLLNPNNLDKVTIEDAVDHAIKIYTRLVEKNRRSQGETFRILPSQNRK